MNTIMAQKRDPSAKAKRLRRLGIVPCVVYGAPLTESFSVQIEQSAAKQLKRTMRNGSKVAIQVDGNTYPTLIKNLEYNGMTDEVVHISFQILDPEKRVSSVADIVLINKEKVAGILEQMQLQVPHAAHPEYLLDTVTVDLEDMPIGTTLTIGDILEFQSDKIQLQADAGNIVLRIRDKKRAQARAGE